MPRGAIPLRVTIIVADGIVSQSEVPQVRRNTRTLYRVLTGRCHRRRGVRAESGPAGRACPCAQCQGRIILSRYYRWDPNSPRMALLPRTHQPYSNPPHRVHRVLLSASVKSAKRHGGAWPNYYGMLFFDSPPLLFRYEWFLRVFPA